MEGENMKEQEEEILPQADVIDSTQSLHEFIGTPEEVIARHVSCSLCGSRLHFTHYTDFSRNLTQEVAKCPECQIKIRKVMYRLQ